MNTPNANNTAVITGASSGIGAVYADRLAQRGYDLLLIARDQKRLSDRAANLTLKIGRSVDILPADLTLRSDLLHVEERLRSDHTVTALVRKPRFTIWVGLALTLIILAVAVLFARGRFVQAPARTVAPPLPEVAVSQPLESDIDTRLQFLGQFSAVERVELRAQVGGTLTQIRFKDGVIVQKGDLLFVIDPVPYEIKLAEATAQRESARARLDLANRELSRAQMLRRNGVVSAENLDQRTSDQEAAQAAFNGAQAQLRDAQFDLDHCRIVAPFTGRIGSHLVSVGNLVAGSRTGSSPTTLLATMVSLDPIYLDFDMSESDYMAFLREREKQKGPLAEKVQVSLSDEKGFTHDGTLDFVDNALDRSSGTIHARATVPNSDLLLTPGGFARVRVEVAPPALALLVPDASVLPDQSEHIVLTVGPNNVVTPKQVQIGDLRGGLRVIHSGLMPSDQVIIDGIPIVLPGAKVTPHNESIRFGSDQNAG
jgi:RND family efflux transporter MFP subunit